MALTDGQPSARGVEPTSSSVVELRQYTLHAGKRDVLIDLFDRELVESQEALGMKVIGQFHDVPRLKGPPERLRLTPTARSLLTGGSLGCAAVSLLDLET